MEKYPMRYWVPGLATEYVEEGCIQILTAVGSKQIRAQRIHEHASKWSRTTLWLTNRKRAERR